MNAPARHSPVSLSVKIPSRIEAVEALCLTVRDTLQGNGLGQHLFPVELLTRECLANALNHGNRRDGDKSIELRLSVGRRWIRLEVGDEGPGFNWRKGLRREEDDDATSGRGLPMYELYAERVRFNRPGNRITLWIGRGETKEE